MQRGALAMFDALGFKGIWKRGTTSNHAEAVISKLRDLKASTDRSVETHRSEFLRIEKAGGLDVAFDVDVIFLSDTVIIGASTVAAGKPAPSSPENDWCALQMVSELTSVVIGRAARGSIPFAYRGCIAFGDFILDKQFIVGAAVDAAAEAMNSAEAALVWFAPSARAVMRAPSVRALGNLATADGLIRPHSVPLKGGARYATHVVSPFRTLGGPTERLPYIRQISQTFVGDQLDIAVKQQHTLEFLKSEHARLRRAERRS